MGKTILIIEDEKDVAAIYAKHLTAAGYDCVLAFDGFQGLDKLKTIKPDLILLDLSLPKMSGIEFYQYICGIDGMPRYPLLVLTGRMDLTEIFKDMHVDGYLIKPFESARLLSEVEVILHNQYWRSKDGHARRVMIVDDNELSSSMIATLFSEVGYTCEVAGSGVQAIEKITSDPPDLAVVSLSLADLSGDVVILRLQNMAKTRYVKYILYVQKNYMHEKAILEQFSHKTGVKVMCEYNKPIEIVEAVINVFNHS